MREREGGGNNTRNNQISEYAEKKEEYGGLDRVGDEEIRKNGGGG